MQRGLADFLGCEDSLVLAGGYLTNVTAIDALLADGDLLIHDA
ncbi:hypothetical protein [Lentzea jiangxiensis]|nr:hypothetical protein [Lentzea jiangxiensis]